MATRKVCRTEGCGNEKARGNATNCHECWLVKQPPQVQIEYADLRLAAVPPGLRVARVPKELWPPGRRWCAGCQSFVRIRDLATATASRCRGCAARASREYRLETEYSLTPEEYDLLFKAQGGRCYFCGRRSIRVPLAVDHDHRTGEVRGLLCPDPNYGCNMKIMARIDADADPLAFALRIVEYVRNPPARRILRR